MGASLLALAKSIYYQCTSTGRLGNAILVTNTYKSSASLRFFTMSYIKANLLLYDFSLTEIRNI